MPKQVFIEFKIWCPFTFKKKKIRGSMSMEGLLKDTTFNTPEYSSDNTFLSFSFFFPCKKFLGILYTKTLLLFIQQSCIRPARQMYSRSHLSYAQDNLGVKKVLAPSENPKKCPIICFASDKK
jgi:hypothetical protein